MSSLVDRFIGDWLDKEYSVADTAQKAGSRQFVIDEITRNCDVSVESVTSAVDEAIRKWEKEQATTKEVAESTNPLEGESNQPVGKGEVILDAETNPKPDESGHVDPKPLVDALVMALTMGNGKNEAMAGLRIAATKDGVAHAIFDYAKNRYDDVMGKIKVASANQLTGHETLGKYLCTAILAIGFNGDSSELETSLNEAVAKRRKDLDEAAKLPAAPKLGPVPPPIPVPGADLEKRIHDLGMAAIEGFQLRSEPIVVEQEVMDFILIRANAQLDLLELDLTVIKLGDLPEWYRGAEQWLKILQAVEPNKAAYEAAEKGLMKAFNERRKVLEGPPPVPVPKTEPAKSNETLAYMAIEAFLGHGTAIVAEGEVLDLIILKANQHIDAIVAEVNKASSDKMALWEGRGDQYLALLKAAEPEKLTIAAKEEMLKEAYEKRRKELEEASEATKKPVPRVVPKESTGSSGGGGLPPRRAESSGVPRTRTASSPADVRSAERRRSTVEQWNGEVVEKPSRGWPAFWSSVTVVGVFCLFYVVAMLLPWAGYPEVAEKMMKGQNAFTLLAGVFFTLFIFWKKEGFGDAILSGVCCLFLGLLGGMFLTTSKEERATWGDKLVQYPAGQVTQAINGAPEQAQEGYESKPDPVDVMAEFDQGNPYANQAAPETTFAKEELYQENPFDSFDGDLAPVPQPVDPLVVGGKVISLIDLAAIGAPTDASAMASIGYFYGELGIEENIPGLRAEASSKWQKARKGSKVDPAQVKARQLDLLLKVGGISGMDEQGNVLLNDNSPKAKAELNVHLKNFGRRQ